MTEEGTNLIKANHACTENSPVSLDESLTCWTFLKCYREINFVNYFKSIPLISFYFILSRSKSKFSPALQSVSDDDVVDDHEKKLHTVNVGINSNRVEMEKVLHYRKCLDMEHIPSCVHDES